MNAADSAENRKILPIFLIVLIDVLGLTIILPLLPFYSERFGATPFTVGMLVSSYALCQLISGPFLGRWSDHVGRKPLLLVSQAGTCAGFLLLAYSNSLALIFLSRIIDGLTAGNLSLAQAYISDVSRPERRAAAFGKIGVAFGVGFFLGPSLTAGLFHYGFRAPILAAAFLSFCSIVCTAVLLPSGKVGAAADVPAKVREKGLFAFGTYRKYFKSPPLRSLLLQIFIFYFTFSAYVSGFALFAERRFTFHGEALGPKQVGYAFAYFGALGIILQGFLIGRLVKHFGERKLVHASFLACVLGYVALSFIDGPFWIAVTGLFTGFGNGVLRPVLTSEISRAVGRGEQGTVLGLNQSLQSVGQILAPLAGTFLIGHSLLAAWAWFPAAICLVGTWLCFTMPKERGTYANP
jgi:DHA1 family tetracycline resistance protein-like MFS transporter